ncbi:hypothetical protein HK101_008257 [Irineochytrium annulatum]|nr:hypothetical protein HK101_008257 [Irineochytrium annulatum]
MSARFVKPEALVSLIRSPARPGVDYLVVDMRDEDFAGGNIVGAINIPAHEFLEDTKSYADKLKKVKTLVFHCALSQVRGPKCANHYVRTVVMDDVDRGGKGKQEVWILEGGFSVWQYRYKDEKDLVENYDPASWVE